MVVESIIHHWVTVVTATEKGTEGLGMSVWDLVVYFHTGDELVDSTQLERLQRVFNVLTGLFYRFGLNTNTRKMVIMAFQS